MGREFTRVTSNGVMSITVSRGYQYSVEEIRLHCNSTPTMAENFTITMISGVNSLYNTRFLTTAMSGISNVFWQPEKEINIPVGDNLQCAYTNTNSVPWGIEIIARKGGT